MSPVAARQVSSGPRGLASRGERCHPHHPTCGGVPRSAMQQHRQHASSSLASLTHAGVQSSRHASLQGAPRVPSGGGWGSRSSGSGRDATTTSTTMATHASSSSEQQGAPATTTATAATAAATTTTSLGSDAWQAFSDAVSGEWDGVTVSFDGQGQPTELPPYYVPEAFREWGVTLYDWQTQCTALATPEGLSYTERKLFPTVGCEADAIAFEEEAVAALRTTPERAGEDKTILGDGSYTLGPRELPPGPPQGVNPADAPADTLKLEFCLVGTAATATTTTGSGDSSDGSSSSNGGLAALGAALGGKQRLRVVVVAARGGPAAALAPGGDVGAWRLREVTVSRERFDRPWDGRQELAGCGGGLPKFAETPPTDLAAAADGGADGSSGGDGEGRRWHAEGGAWYAVEEGSGAFRLAGGAPMRGDSWGEGSASGPGAVIALPLGLWVRLQGSGGDLAVEVGALMEGGKRRKVAGRRFEGARLRETWIGADALAE